MNLLSVHHESKTDCKDTFRLGSTIFPSLAFVFNMLFPAWEKGVGKVHGVKSEANLHDNNDLVSGV